MTRRYTALVSVTVLFLIQLCFIDAKLVKYTLEAYYFEGSPDGVYKDKILGYNGQFPGPTLQAEVGDTLEVMLVNKIQDGQNTSIHWHGLAQRGSLFEDGTSMISQCPLPSGRSQVYRFNLTHAGTYWYHSHVNSQYTEGMFGALIVHAKKEAYEYDGEVTLMLSDWYHQTAHENEAWHLSPPSRGVPPYPNSGLINGIGRYPCPVAKMQNRSCLTSNQMRPFIRIERDKTYRIRLVNAAAVSMFNFSVDGHILKAIEVDGIDVKTPVSLDYASIAAGQRYSFLIKCDKSARTDQRFLIRANMRKESFMLIEDVNINKYPEALMHDVTAVLECTTAQLRHEPKTQVEMFRENFTCNDVVPPLFAGDDRIMLDETLLRPLDGSSAPDYYDEEFLLNVGFYEDFEDIRRGSFNASPFTLPEDKPLLMKLVDGEPLPAGSFPLEIKHGSVVQVVLNNPFFGPHPFHLHGHHFWILGTGAWYEGDYDPNRHNLTLNTVFRDTVLLQEQSWAVIRFVADNPGLWTFHCHIDWHNLSGMALTFVEGAEIVRKEVKVTEEALRVCEMHKYFNRTSTYPKQKQNLSPSHFHFRGR